MNTMSLSDRILKPDDWRVPYVGRAVLGNFQHVFSDTDCDTQVGEFVYTKKFKWIDEPSCESGNCYDEYWNIHYLKIEIYEAGSLKGHIRHISSFHTRHFHTSSNWQDHAESSQYEVRGANVDEIKEYCRVLDSCTKTIWPEFVFEFFKTIAAQDESARLRYDYVYPKKCWRIDFPEHTVWADEVERVFQEALSCPDVLIFDWIGYRKERLTGQAKKDLDWFLSRLDIKSFYLRLGLSAREKYKLILERMSRDSCETWSFMNISKCLGQNILESRLEEVLQDKERTYGFIPQQKPAFWERPGGGILEPVSAPNDEILQSIPTGSLCFMGKDMGCVGFVTPEGVAYRFAYAKRECGHITPDGEIYIKDGTFFNDHETRVGRTYRSGICEDVGGKTIYYAHVDHGGMVFVISLTGKAYWNGYVLECLGTTGHSREVATAPYNRKEFDIRLGGLAIFTGVDVERLKENARIHQIACNSIPDDVYD